MRTVKDLHPAPFEPISGLLTYRAMPTPSLPMNTLDPFLFLNHHGWQDFEAENKGLPFGPHPHRGFETVTFILEGDLVHKDSSGADSRIESGGVQWMTAGRGLSHAEVSSEHFMKYGGPLEILQLWVNLPARFKMTPPQYVGLQKDSIPSIDLDGGKVTVRPVSGNWNGTRAPFEPIYDISLASIYFSKNGKASFSVAKEKNILLYIVKGFLEVNNRVARMHDLVEFDHDDETIELKASADAIVLFGYATPFHEAFAAHGPFVMNTREEIMQAYEDFRNGTFQP